MSQYIFRGKAIPSTGVSELGKAAQRREVLFQERLLFFARGVLILSPEAFELAAQRFEIVVPWVGHGDGRRRGVIRL